MVKKSLQILLLLLMAMPWVATGQTIQIGHGTGETWGVPINIRRTYGYTQMIYSKSDIEAGSPNSDIILSIAFEHVSGQNSDYDITVFMKNVDYEMFTSTSYEQLSADDIVYQGTVHPIDGWTPIELDTPFTYNPDKHLLIAINKTSINTVTNGKYHWKYYSKGSDTPDINVSVLYNSSEYDSGMTSPYDPYSTTLVGRPNTKVPNVQITFYEFPGPSDFVANLTPGVGTIATLSWTELYSSTDWELQYGTDATFATCTTVTSGFNTTAAPTISYDLTGLTAETKYYARVRSHLNNNKYTHWSDVISFIPTIYASLTVNEPTSVGTGTASYVPFFRAVANYENIMSQFIIPATDILDVQGGGINSLTFYNTMTTVDYGDAAFKVYVKEVDYTTLEEYAEWESLTNVYTGTVNVAEGKLKITFDTPYLYNGGNLLVGFKQNNNLGHNASNDTKWYGDEGKPEKSSRYTYGSYNKALTFLPETTIQYLANNGCVKPSLLNVSSELKTATLTWLSKASQWQVAHATSATADPNDYKVPGEVNAMTYTFNDLTLGDHYFWVRSYCSSSEQSEWVGPVSTHVGFCTPAPTNLDGDCISNVTFGKDGLIVNNDTPKAGYLDCTDKIGEVKAGYDAKIAITYATGYSYGTIIWVDLNQNMIFEESEILYKGQSDASIPTTLNAFIYIPPTQALGYYYMRIGGADSAFDDYIDGSSTVAPDPCYSGAWACFQDYTIQLVEAPECPPAHNIAVTSIGYTATLTWESEASLWDIAYSTSSTTNPDECETCIVQKEWQQTTYVKNDMADGYNYFWIRTHCASDIHSDWSDPIEAYIGYCTPEPGYVDGDGISNVTFGSGEHVVNNDTPVADYADYSNLVGDLQAGVWSPVDITYETGYSYGTIIWIDFNNNLLFEESEIVYTGESTNESPMTLNASVYIPDTIAVGNYRMRIGGADDAFDEYIKGTSTVAPDPCYSDYYATFQDYTVHVTEAPSCLPTINLTATEDQSDRSVLDWTSLNTDEESWTIYYKKESEASYTSILADTKPYTLTGLASATTYQYYVVVKCEGDDTSYPSGVCTFTTACPEYAAIPLNEDFDSYSVSSSAYDQQRVLPSCWDYINGSSSYNNDDYPTISSNNYAHTQPNYMSFYCIASSGYDYDPQDQYAILPDMQNINTLRLKLYARVNIIKSNYDATFMVGVMEGDNFVQVGDAITPTSDIYQQYVIPFDSYTGTGTQIAIKMAAPEIPTTPSSSNCRSVFIDDITVETIPNCTEPTGLELTASSLHSLSLQWTAGGSESNWLLQYKKNTATEWTQVENYLTNHSYTLEGLDASTIYNVRVAAVCDPTAPDGISEFCDPGTFATDCDYVSTFPWVNDFEDQSDNTVPLCWDNSGSETSTINSKPDYVWGVYTCNDNKMIRMNNYYVAHGSALINTPEIHLPAGAKELTFTYANQASCGDLIVKISNDGGTTFTALKSLPQNNESTSYTVPSTTEDVAISLSAYANMTVILQFYANANYGSGAIFIDDVRIDDIPECAKPSFFACDSKTAHTATFSWTNGSEGQDAWQIAYSTEADFDPNSVTPVAVTTNPGTITGLTPSTTYYAFVRANCGGGVFSAWNKNKVAFTTAIGNAAPYNLAVIPATITTSAASVNWSRDKANDLHESFDLYYSTNEIMPDVLVPESLITGITDTIYSFTTLSEETTYYVWVRDICGADGQSEWTSSINFATPSSCQTPDGLAESDVTTTSAKISWNTYGLTSFNLRYSTDGTNWVVKENVNSPYSITELTFNTEYTVQVQAACNTAVWSNEYKFYTECGAYTIDALTTYTQDFESPVTEAAYSSSNIEMPRCWDNYSDNTSLECTKPHLIKAGSQYNFAPTGQVLYFYGSGNNYAMLPEFTNDLNTLQINFKYATESASYGDLSLGYITDEDVDYNTFTTIKSYDNTSNHAFVSVTEYLNNLPATASRLVFLWSYESQWGANIDDVTVSLLPSCYPVTNLSYDNVLASTASLSWDLYDNTQNSWQVQYATNAEFTTGVNTVSANTHENFALNELTAETHYYVRVRAFCGGESYSDWCDAVDFTTTVSCPAPTNVATTNITQQTVDISWTGDSEAYNVRYGYDTPDVVFQTNFEDNLIPSGWDNSSSYPWVVVTEGDNHFMRSGNQGVANSASTISATVTLTDVGFISFDARCMGEGTTTVHDKCIFMIDDEVMFTIGANGEQWDYYEFDIEDGTHTLTWSYTKDNGVNNPGDAFSVDNIVIGYHNMHWNIVSDIATTSTQLTGLTSNTDYAIRVQGVCGGTPGNLSAIVYVGTLAEGNKVFVTAGSWDNPNNWIPTGVPTLTDEVILRANVTIESGSVAYADKVTRQGSPMPTITIEDGGQLFANALLTAIVKKSIAGYDDLAATNKGFHLIATPTVSMNPATANLITDDLGTTATTETSTYDLYQWDGTATAQWLNYRANSFNMINGKGYLYASRDGVEATFSGPIINNANDKSFNLVYNTTAAVGTWNLIGNPFVCNATISVNEGTVNYYKIGTGEYDGELVAASGVVAPMEGIFVEANEDGQQATFSRALPNTSNDNNDGILEIALNSGKPNSRGMSRIDNARIRFGEGNELRKFQLNNNHSKVYIPQDGTDYAVVYAEGEGAMPVNVKVNKTGNYTISFSNEDVNFNYLHLIDKMTGEDVDLLIDESYTFAASVKDYADRFILVFKVGDNNYNPESDMFAYQCDSEIIVNGEGTLYIFDVMGRFVGSYEINGNKRIGSERFTDNVYIFKLIGETVKTQKIVVR